MSGYLNRVNQFILFSIHLALHNNLLFLMTSSYISNLLFNNNYKLMNDLPRSKTDSDLDVYSVRNLLT